MATKKDLIISIGPDGNIKIAVEGVAGSECMDFTKFLEEELGEVTERVRTGEYYQQPVETEETIKIRGDD